MMPRIRRMCLFVIRRLFISSFAHWTSLVCHHDDRISFLCPLLSGPRGGPEHMSAKIGSSTLTRLFLARLFFLGHILFFWSFFETLHFFSLSFLPFFITPTFYDIINNNCNLTPPYSSHSPLRSATSPLSLPHSPWKTLHTPLLL